MHNYLKKIQNKMWQKRNGEENAVGFFGFV